MLAETPHQADNWSYGHRVLLTFRRLIDAGVLGRTDAGAWTVALDSVFLEEKHVSAEALQSVCRAGGPVDPEAPEMRRLWPLRPPLRLQARRSQDPDSASNWCGAAAAAPPAGPEIPKTQVQQATGVEARNDMAAGGMQEQPAARPWVAQWFR